MASKWKEIPLRDLQHALEVFAELKGKRWVCRGQSNKEWNLVPLIDRDKLAKLTRAEKLSLERQSINLFRSTVKFFAAAGEQNAMVDDVIALMVMRHYGVETRLLDWTGSPYVAAYFAACDDDRKDGVIWSFDEPLYEKNGKEQWRWWPETTIDGSGDDDKFAAGLTAFTLREPADWIICAYYREGFPRQNAQQGAYTMTARFNRDHAKVMARLLGGNSRIHRCIVPSATKRKLLSTLRDEHGIWHGSLFPDSAGAAATASAIFSRFRGCTLLR